jgi:hypothetical protein
VGAQSIERWPLRGEAAVDPMSPRLASAMIGTSVGTLDSRRSSAEMPPEPKASKKARFRLHGGGVRERGSRDQAREALEPG